MDISVKDDIRIVLSPDLQIGCVSEGPNFRKVETFYKKIYLHTGYIPISLYDCIALQIPADSFSQLLNWFHFCTAQQVT